MTQNQIKYIKRAIAIALLLGLALSVISTYAAQRAPRVIKGLSRALPATAKLPQINPNLGKVYHKPLNLGKVPAGPSHLMNLKEPKLPAIQPAEVQPVPTKIPAASQIQQKPANPVLTEHDQAVLDAAKFDEPASNQKPTFTQEQIDRALEAAKFDDAVQKDEFADMPKLEEVIEEEPAQAEHEKAPQAVAQSAPAVVDADQVKPNAEKIVVKEEPAEAAIEKTPQAVVVGQPAPAAVEVIQTPALAQEFIPEPVTVIDVVPNAVHVVPEVAPIHAAQAVHVVEQGVAAVPQTEQIKAVDVIDGNVYDPQLHNGSVDADAAAHVTRGITPHAQKGKLKRTAPTRGPINHVQVPEAEIVVEQGQAQLPKTEVALKNNADSFDLAKVKKTEKRRPVKATLKMPAMKPEDAQELKRKRADMNLAWEQKLKEDARAKRLAREEERKKQQEQIKKLIEDGRKERKKKKRRARPAEQIKRPAKPENKKAQEVKEQADVEAKEKEKKVQEHKQEVPEKEVVPEKEQDVEIRETDPHEEGRLEPIETCPEPIRRGQTVVARRTPVRRGRVARPGEIDPRTRGLVRAEEGRLRRVEPRETRPEPIERGTVDPRGRRLRRVNPRRRPNLRPEFNLLRFPGGIYNPRVPQPQPQPQPTPVDDNDPETPMLNNFSDEPTPRPERTNPTPAVNPVVPPAAANAAVGIQRTADISVLLKDDLYNASESRFRGSTKKLNQLQQAFNYPVSEPLRQAITDAVASYNNLALSQGESFENCQKLYAKVQELVVKEFGSTAIPLK